MNDYLIKSYFDWLTLKIDFEDKTMMYDTLLQFLFNKDFVWLESIPLDANRATDGIDLRKKFAKLLSPNEGQQFKDIMLNKPCSMLEMFIAFSERLVQLVSLEPYEFFWMFIDNLNLGWATENDFDQDIVNREINDFLLGTVNGMEPVGDQKPPVLFPCRETYNNLNLDLYMQANLYLKSWFI